MNQTISLVSQNPNPITLIIKGFNTNQVTQQIAIVNFGSFYQAGFIFAIDDTTPNTQSIGGKVAAKLDSSSIIWTPVAISMNALSLTNGKQNTIDIINQVPTYNPLNTYAAGLCSLKTSGNYNDWYLPAICEMDATSAGTGCTPMGADIQTNLVNTPNFALYNFQFVNYYWSSTRIDSSSAWSELFSSSGTSISASCTFATTNVVRCARELT